MPRTPWKCLTNVRTPYKTIVITEDAYTKLLRFEPQIEPHTMPYSSIGLHCSHTRIHVYNTVRGQIELGLNFKRQRLKKISRNNNIL
jgi:hypothetical protein